MKITLLLGVTLFITSLFSNPARSNEIIDVDNFGENPGNLEMKMYIPESVKHDSVSNIPLVVALHGCSQTLKNLMEGSGWNQLAEEHGFIVIYPMQKFINNTSLCFNWFKNKDISKNSGENGSIYNMVEYVTKNFSIDQQKIFIYGLSAGAAMSVSMMVNYPEIFNAGAIFAGAPHGIAKNGIQGMKVMLSVPNKTSEQWGKEIPDYDQKTNYPNLVVVHGEMDNVVSIQSSFELIKQWKYLKKVENNDRIEDQKFKGNEKVQRISYLDSSKNENIIFYQIKGIGHEITVDEGAKENQGGKANMYATNIGFYSTYYVAKDFGLLKE
ncbi:MAG: PHB depolymerase family esterase [Brumimicrobium sp.]